MDDPETRKIELAGALIETARTLRFVASLPLPLSAQDESDLETAAQLCVRISRKLAIVETRGG